MKRIIVSMLLGLMIFLSTETISLKEVTSVTYKTETEIVTETNNPNIEDELKVSMVKLDTQRVFKPIPQKQKQPQYINLGEFKITAYCSCYICCEEHSLNRPLDENGNPIVYGASGERLTPQYSIAVDPRVIPYGTEVIFNGNTYIAHDCGGAIKQNRIDLYFNDHQEALNWGVRYHEVFIEN